jgi:hypothetical protein
VIAGRSAQRRSVTLGGSSGAEVTVLDGLAVGEQVAVSALDRLQDGSAVSLEGE